MRLKGVISAGLLCARWLCAGQGFDFGNYQVVSTAPLGGSSFEYVLKVQVTNRAADALGVTAQVFSTVTNTTVLSGLVGFGDVVFGQSALSTNVFRIRQFGSGLFNPSPLQWFVSVQSMPLSVSVDTPVNALLTNGTSVLVSGSVGPAVDGVTVGRTNVSLTGGHFSSLVTLEEGRNIITVVATNAFGGSGAANVTVNRDTTAPYLSIETPTNGTVAGTRQITVTGQINDAVPGTVNPEQATVTVNGETAALLNRSYAASDVLLAPGTNRIMVVGRDRAGNETPKEIEVIFREPAGQKRLVALAGDGQVSVVSTSLPEPLLVELVDQNGVAQTNQPITFSVARGDGVVLAPPDSGRTLTLPTDEKGRASVVFRLGTRAGSGNNQVEVGSPGAQALLTFSAHGLGAAPARVSPLIPETQVGEVGKPLAQPWTALVTDVEGNPVEGAPVTFLLMQGGGSFEGQTMLATNTDSDGRASAVLTLGPEPGVNNHVVLALVAGVTNSPATFVASAQTPQAVPNTRIVGLVLDNANRPMSNVLCIIYRTFLAAVTDANGRFVISNAPVGAIRLLVDARERGYPGEWHALEFDLVTVAGRDNSVDRPIYMLPLDSDNAVLAGGPQDVSLRLKGIPGATMTVFANSLRDNNGHRITNRVSWTEVNQERVPMAPPKGAQFSLAWTVQPPGLRFDPPARICIPNAGHSPGRMLEMFGFDHDLGAFVSLGTGTVTPDGSQVCSDAGFGVTKSGWGGFLPAPPPCCAVCAGPRGESDAGGLKSNLQPEGGPLCFDLIIHPSSSGCDCARFEQRPKRLVSNVAARINGQEQAFGGTNTVFNFTVTSDHPACASLTYHWDFGDGETSAAQNPTHKFTARRTYHPKVVVACQTCPESKLTNEVTAVVGTINLVVHRPKRIDPAESEVPHDKKLTVGGQTFENLDNDDSGSSGFDLNKNTVAGGDDELLKVRIQLPAEVDLEGRVRLEVTEGAENVRLWTLDTKTLELGRSNELQVADFADVPGGKEYTLYVEGIQAHTTPQGTTLRARFLTNSMTLSEDKAAITVLGLAGLAWEGKFNSVANLNWADDGVNHPLDPDPNWPTALTGALSQAVRVFPDARIITPLGQIGPPRNKVTVKARLSVAPTEPVKFQFRSFDVDDPTADQDLVDDDISVAVAEDNRGIVPARAGKLVGSDAKGVLEVTFNAGEAEKSFEFETTMQPGDNFRVVGSFDPKFIGDLVNDDYAPYCARLNDAKQQIFHPSNSLPILKPQAYGTPTLTVWRFLHLELDTMSVVVTNLMQGVITNVNLVRTQAVVSASLDDSSPNLDFGGLGRFERGTLRLADTHDIGPLDGNGVYYFNRGAGLDPTAVPLPFEADGFLGSLDVPVRGTVTNLHAVGGVLRGLDLKFTEGNMEFIRPGRSEIRIGGGPSMKIGMTNAASVEVDLLRIPFVVTDDDAIKTLLPPHNTAGIAPIWAPAYVLPVFDAIWDSIVPFHPNSADADQAAHLLSGKGAPMSTNSFWIITILNAYQTGLASDNDPDTEGTDRGVSHLLINAVILCMESIRDWTATPVAKDGGNATDPAGPGRQLRIQEILNHEIGHQFGQNHPDGKVTPLEPNGGVEAASCCPPDNPASNTRGASTFTRTGLDKIRRTKTPGANPFL